MTRLWKFSKRRKICAFCASKKANFAQTLEYKQISGGMLVQDQDDLISRHGKRFENRFRTTADRSRNSRFAFCVESLQARQIERDCFRQRISNRRRRRGTDEPRRFSQNRGDARRKIRFAFEKFGSGFRRVFSRFAIMSTKPRNSAFRQSFSRAARSKTKKLSRPQTNTIWRWSLPAFGISNIKHCVKKL